MKLNLVKTYILFAIDYGFPFYTENRVNIYNIPIFIAKMPTPIIRVSLDVLPAKTKINYFHMQESTEYHNEWSVEGIETFYDCIKNAVVTDLDVTLQNLEFHNTFFVSMHVTKPSGKVINVNEKLIDNNVAVKPNSVKEFWKLIQNTDIINEKWNNFNRSGGILKEKPDIDDLPDIAKLFENFPPNKIDPRIEEKVLSWLAVNEKAQEKENPVDEVEYESRADSDYLYDFYASRSNQGHKSKKNSAIQKEKEEDEIPMTLNEVRRELKKIELLEKGKSSKIRCISEKPLEIYPSGYPIQVIIQGLPKKFEDTENVYDDQEFISALNVGVNTDNEHNAAGGNDDNDYDKWD